MTSPNPKRQWHYFVLVLMVSPCFCCWGRWTIIEHPRKQFVSLLSGEQGIRVTKFTGGPFPREYVLNDAETLTYLSNAFRTAVPEGYNTRKHDDFDRSGPTLHPHIWTDILGPVQISMEFPNNGTLSGVIVCCPRDELDDAFFFYVALPQPVPAALVEIINEEREWERIIRSKKQDPK